MSSPFMEITTEPLRQIAKSVPDRATALKLLQDTPGYVPLPEILVIFRRVCSGETISLGSSIAFYRSTVELGRRQPMVMKVIRNRLLAVLTTLGDDSADRNNELRPRTVQRTT